MTRKEHPISRRDVLKQGAVVASAGAAALGTPSVLESAGQAPAVQTATRFKAWISRGNGPGRTTLHEVTLRPISGRQVVVRTEATNLCYNAKIDRNQCRPLVNAPRQPLPIRGQGPS